MAQADPKSKTVLIVDDDEPILNLLDILVRRDGFRVLRADSGDAAIYRLSQKPDAILLDLVMPGGKSGVEVLKHLRESPDPAPPVIVVTGHDASHPSVIEAKADPNVSHFVPKPINQDKLLMLLHRLLGTRAPESTRRKATGERD